MNTILTREWWKAAGLRALRTAGALAVPYLGGSLLGAVPWLTILSAAALGAVLSLLTSLVGIPSSNNAPLWVTLLEKSVKTFAQALVTGIGNAVLFQVVDWSVIVQTAAIATLVTVLLVVVGTVPDANPVPLPVVLEPRRPIDSRELGRHIAAERIQSSTGPNPPTV